MLQQKCLTIIPLSVMSFAKRIMCHSVFKYPSQVVKKFAYRNSKHFHVEYNFIYITLHYSTLHNV